MTRITVFTPTYNRADCIHRVYDSLSNQTYRDFEWIVVDDGSTDATRSLVEKWKQNSSFPITYIYQDHAGKHRAWNTAVRRARGEFFVIADSDDGFLPEALQRMLDMWNTIPASSAAGFRGITCRCYSSDGPTVIGDADFPNPYLDARSPDVVFRWGLNYEMWGMNRTAVMREYPMPDIPGLRFFPEIIIWDMMSRKYKSRFFNTPLRIIYDDQADRTTTSGRNNRFRENYYLWRHYLNDMGEYFTNSPKLFCKAAIGIVRDGILSGRRMGRIFAEIHSPLFKIVAGGAPQLLFFLHGATVMRNGGEKR